MRFFLAQNVVLTVRVSTCWLQRNLKLGTLSKRIIFILLHVVHWFFRWQHRCCRASLERCSDYLFGLGGVVCKVASQQL